MRAGHRMMAVAEQAVEGGEDFGRSGPPRRTQEERFYFIEYIVYWMLVGFIR
jgi:hypothetical protein